MKLILFPRQIRQRLFGAFLSLAVIPLCLAGLLLSWQNQNSYLANSYTTQKSHAHHIAKDLHSTLENIEMEMQLLERFNGLMTLKKEEQQNVLWHLLANKEVYQEVHLLNSLGEKLHCLSPNSFKSHDPPKRDPAIDQEVHFPLKNGKTFYGSVQFDQANGLPWMYIAIPLFNYQSGEVAGVLTAKIKFKHIWQMLNDHMGKEGEDIYILNAANQVIGHSNPTIVLRGTRFNGVPRDTPQPGLHGKSALIAEVSTRLGQETFRVIVQQSVAVALQPVKKSIIFICLILLAALLCSLILADIAVRHLFIPLEKLMTATRELIAGNYGKQVQIPDGEELADLAMAFNKMSRSLQETLESLNSEIHDRREAEEAMRKSEERFRALTENTSDWIWEIDAQGRYTYSSPRIKDLLGYEPQEVLGKSPFDLMCPDEQRNLEGFFKKVTEKKEPIHGMENSNIHKNGSVVILETNAVPILDTTGKLLGYRGIDRDISERKKNEEEKSLLEARLRQAQKMEAIGTLAGGIAHDFNNILTPIIGYTEMAIGMLSEESEIGKKLQEVNKAGFRAKDLVQQILQFSREGEQEAIMLQPHLVIKEAVKLLRSSIPTNIEISQHIENCGSIEADPTQLHQITMNLCTNAYHAMRETGGTMAITLKTVELTEDDTKVISADLTPGSYVQLSVSDNGAGMDHIVLERIFDPYFTTKKQGEGTGLGLAIVHGIVKSYDGHIMVYSEAGQGTTFHVYLPQATIKEEAGADSIDKRRKRILPQGKERILIVDDEEVIVDLEKQMLAGLGYEITTFIDSEAALETFVNAPQDFDLIITDMAMPNLTGLALAQKVFEVRKGMPIIICTGFSELLNEKKAKAMGIKEYIMKPVIKKEMATVVRKVLDKEDSAALEDSEGC